MKKPLQMQRFPLEMGVFRGCEKLPFLVLGFSAVLGYFWRFGSVLVVVACVFILMRL
ncbi:hypothetical protein [Staphylococcus aureus]|uniref:hypothetical protein n=1 Tax=Staphylococcus aureus TaxID=1280 RepID=UPI0030F3B04D